MAIDKLLEYDSRPDETGEALVHPASGSLEKTAGSVHPDVQQHLSQAGSPPGDMMRLLITALSSYDTFGPNKNGDGFYRQDLLRNVDYGKRPDGGGRLNIPMYRSFEHFARPYKHHRNSESSPAYGEIERAFFNPQMDRVELVTLLDTAKAPQIARRIENYEPVKTSMGFRAAYDTCSVCGNRAKSRRDYCDHLKNNMLSVRPDGHIVHARNPKGKFFDISFVGTPADGTSRAVHVGRLPVGDGIDLNRKNDATGPVEDSTEPTAEGGERGSSGSEEGGNAEGDAEDEEKEARRSFAKAACVGWASGQDVKLSSERAEEEGLDGSEPLRRKTASEEGKQSSIDKRVDANVEDVSDLSPEKEEKLQELVERIRGSAPMIQEKLLERLSGYPLETVASTMTMAGVSLRPEEMQHIALTKAGAPELARTLREEGRYLRPETKTADVGLSLGFDKVNARLLSKIVGTGPLMEKRSFRRGPLIERMSSEENVKTAAGLGPNPYLRHREPITPQKAREIATQEEQGRLEGRQSGEPKRTSMLEYLAHLLIGSEWNQARPSPQQREALRSSYSRRPRPRPSQQARRARINDRPRPQRAAMMTMPMAHYIRGTGSQQPVYDQAGVAEQAMSKESSLRKWASRHVQSVLQSMEQMDKVATEQVDYVLEDPGRYESTVVEAAMMRRLDESIQ